MILILILLILLIVGMVLYLSRLDRRCFTSPSGYVRCPTCGHPVIEHVDALTCLEFQESCSICNRSKVACYIHGDYYQHKDKHERNERYKRLGDVLERIIMVRKNHQQNSGFKRYKELLDELLSKRASGELDDATEAKYATALNDCRKNMTSKQEASIESLVASRKSRNGPNQSE